MMNLIKDLCTLAALGGFMISIYFWADILVAL